MEQSEQSAEDIVGQRQAMKALAKKARLPVERDALTQRVKNFAKHFTVETTATLARLKRQGWPGGDMLLLPGQPTKIAAWKLPDKHSSSARTEYHLASNGCIYKRDNSHKRHGESPWTVISPSSFLQDALDTFDFFDGEVAWHNERQYEELLERCKLIYPDKTEIVEPERPSFWSRFFRK